MDTTAADMLEELDGELDAKGINLVFAEMKDAVRQEIRHYGMDWLADREAFYPTIGTAVKAYRQFAGIPKPDHHAGPWRARARGRTRRAEVTQRRPAARVHGRASGGGVRRRAPP